MDEGREWQPKTKLDASIVCSLRTLLDKGDAEKQKIKKVCKSINEPKFGFIEPLKITLFISVSKND